MYVKKKAKKDPNAPKKGLSTYMLIARTWDPYWRKKAQNWLFGELGKLLGRKYKELSVEEKAKYDVLAAADDKW